MYFFKESKGDVLLGFTLNLKELKSEIRKGYLCLNRPKLVLLQKTKGETSIEKLGEFVHPYFTLFVQLQSFQCLLAQDDFTDIVYTKYNRLTFNTLSNGLIEIAGNEKFAEECKKMAFFQIGVESNFNLHYISFLEKIYC